jgi:hypothetical protein
VQPVIFGDVSRDSSEGGDYSGTEFRFGLDSGQFRGWVRNAEGGLPAPRPLDSVKFTHDSLRFLDPIEQAAYAYAVSCDSLSGIGYLFLDNGKPGKIVRSSVPRVTDPLPNDP